jgi:hypothetical protein
LFAGLGYRTILFVEISEIIFAGLAISVGNTW